MYTCHKILKIKVRESLEKKNLIACCSVGKVARKRRQLEDKQGRLRINVSRGTPLPCWFCLWQPQEKPLSGSMPKEVPSLGWEEQGLDAQWEDAAKSMGSFCSHCPQPRRARLLGYEWAFLDNCAEGPNPPSPGDLSHETFECQVNEG